MYNHIRGIVVHKSPSQVIVEAGGLGYELTIPLSASGRIPPPGGETTILVHLIVREDALRLIGFSNEGERALFRELIELSGVGPSMALQILSGMTPAEFLQAVDRQDADALKRIKGIGDKMAKRIILEMKGAKMLLTPEDGGNAVGAGVPAEAVQALVTLGIIQNEAVRRVQRALKDNPDATVEELIKAALR
ncbi:MAG: Holliday junction branch migration protein RuvA [Planctomycetota bacterium]|jgi:Holliday junction DNA helicase RuvA|nr:Holliday junction branch migration protein RuvA [Planctomycetota bacterium]